MSMKNLFFNSLQWPEILVYCILGLCFILVVLFIVAVIIRGKDEEYVVNNSPSTLSITIDINDKTVVIFNMKKMTGIEKISLDEYLSFLSKNSREKVEDFINKVRTNVTDNITNIIETNAFHIKRNKKQFFSVIYITSINMDDGIIHATQYFYDSIPVIEGVDLKRENRIRAMFNVPENIIKNRFVNAGTKGATMLFHYSITNSYKNEDISVLIYYGLINIISKHVNLNRVLVKDKGSDLVLFDFKAYQRHKIYKLVSEIKKQFNKIIEMNAVNNRIKFSIAITEHKFYPRDYHKVMKAAHQTSIEASSKNRDFLFYDNSVREEYYFDQSYRTEVQTIIENHSMKYYFMPIIGVSHCDVIGYFSKIVPISTIFNDINEVKNYSYKLSLSKDLFSENSKHLLSKFVNESSNLKTEKYLFYNLKYHEIIFANSLLGFILNQKRANLVLVFNESDLLKNIDKNEDYTEPFRKLISKGYLLSLEITLKTLELPDELYSLFTYFQFDVEFFDKNFDDISHSSLTMKRSIEKILKYRKKVIVSSVNTWNDVELRIQENLKFLSGDAISPYSEMILPINKKVIDKIKRIKKRG